MITLSHKQLKQLLNKGGLRFEEEIKFLRFNYQSGEELLEIVFVGDVVKKRPLYKIRHWYCKHCNKDWEEPGKPHNCKFCLSEEVEECS